MSRFEIKWLNKATTNYFNFCEKFAYFVVTDWHSYEPGAE
jgi:hypothetical protein